MNLKKIYNMFVSLKETLNFILLSNRNNKEKKNLANRKSHSVQYTIMIRYLKRLSIQYKIIIGCLKSCSVK